MDATATNFLSVYNKMVMNNNMPINNMPLNNIQVNNMQIDNIPMNNMPMNNMQLNNNQMDNMAMNNMQMNNNLINNNQMNINQINNMQLNNDQINNQPNLIEFYQNQINQLEEIIKQKNIEIENLKDILNRNGLNYQNQNFMNLNPMEVIENSKEEKSKEKEIIINVLGGNGNRQYKCFENDYTYKLFEKIYPNSNWNLIKFTYNGKKLHPFLTIKGNGIKDGSYIEKKGVKSIIFNKYKEPMCINIDEDYPIIKAIKYYLFRIGEGDCLNNFKFLYNTHTLNLDDKIPIINLMGFDNSPTITVMKVKFK